MRIWILLPFLGGCSTLSGARPLERGQHEVGVSLGGPMFEFGAPVPLPNVVIGARSGIATLADRPVDLGYGTNLIGLPFGIVSAYGDLGWLVAPQSGARPAIAVRNKLLLTTNAFASNKGDVTLSPRAAWGADELVVLASWQVGGTVVHGSLAQVFDFADPDLLLVPGVGARIDFGEPGGFTLQPELRWWGVHRTYPQDGTLAWVPGRPGALGLHIGLATTLGARRDGGE